MNHTNTRTSQAGFSLVELMVVVAIIGVLAAIAVPSINKYVAKARQTEAKTNLASLYTSEKAFFAEYNQFDARFQAVGYSPEGQLRYNVGFATNAGTAIVNSGTYTFSGTSPAQSVGLPGSYCGTAGTMNRGCSLLVGATNVQPGAITGTSIVNNVAGGSTFIAEARAFVASGAGAREDIWRMTDQKLLTNPQNGIQ